ncbi:MAG: hypothetical protein D6B27_09885 [Gammaproteobacteria bacterium]|nr:MAG: hypothetical protein D6B27_09885 [Gammaproteobacteria bacterium]
MSDNVISDQNSSAKHWMWIIAMFLTLLAGLLSYFLNIYMAELFDILNIHGADLTVPGTFVYKVYGYFSLIVLAGLLLAIALFVDSLRGGRGKCRDILFALSFVNLNVGVVLFVLSLTMVYLPLFRLIKPVIM